MTPISNVIALCGFPFYMGAKKIAHSEIEYPILINSEEEYRERYQSFDEHRRVSAIFAWGKDFNPSSWNDLNRSYSNEGKPFISI